jgi:hypothetical protein
VVPLPGAKTANLALALGIAADATPIQTGFILDDKLAEFVHVIIIVQRVAKIIAARHLSTNCSKKCEEQSNVHGYDSDAANKSA